MTAPDTTDSEPSLAEAFGDLSEALANEGDEPAAEDAAEGEEHPESPQQPQQPDQPAATPAEEGAQPATPQPTAPPEGQPPAQEAREPLTYTVNGQVKPFDGGFIVPGHGAIITNDALPRLQDRLQQADRLVEQNQNLYRQTQEYQKRGGLPAFEKLTISNASLDASATLLLRAVTDENTLIALATDPVARQQLIKELELTGRDAQQKASAAFREAVEREAAQGTTAEQTQTAIHNAVGQLAQQLPGLTADDVAAVRSHAGRMHTAIVRPATPAEAREANVPVGAPIIDLALLHSLLSDRHTLRQSVAQTAQQRQTDALENAARAAAAAPTTVTNGNGKPAAPRPGAGKPPAVQPKQKALNEMSSSELTRAMRTGRIFDLIGDDDNQ